MIVGLQTAPEFAGLHRRVQFNGRIYPDHSKAAACSDQESLPIQNSVKVACGDIKNGSLSA